MLLLTTRLRDSKLRDIPKLNSTMRFLRSLIPSILLLGAGVAEAASSWSFEDAVISVNPKVGDAFKDKFVPTQLNPIRIWTDISGQTLSQVCSQESCNIGLRRQS